MDLNIINKNYPFVEELVDILYTTELNDLIDARCETEEDKKVFIMFILTYFYTFLSIPTDIKKTDELKSELKLFITDLIRNPEKRYNIIQLYKTFENSIKYLHIT